MQRTVHPGGHHAVFPDAAVSIPDLAFRQLANVGETALALEIEIGDRAGDGDERPDQPAVAVHVLHQPMYDEASDRAGVHSSIRAYAVWS